MEDIELIEQGESSKVMTGSRDINNFLDGGYEKGIVTLLYGPSASGKSNYLMLASCFMASCGKKVLYIDTEGGFSLDRIKQICGYKSNEILKNIIIIKPTDFLEQKKAFVNILNETKSENISLVVVDSMT
ncbi:AAA family ATPase, partial [Candidatus Pacearchaeota archaeon]|nr:AAA family ATPase [Candidatus Pacearchaeota archaeon]